MNGITAPNNIAMKQQGLGVSKRRTHKAMVLAEMNLVVPWSPLLALISPHASRAQTGRPPFELEAMLRIRFVQQWFGLSDLSIEKGAVRDSSVAGVCRAERFGAHSLPNQHPALSPPAARPPVGRTNHGHSKCHAHRHRTDAAR